MPAANIRPLTSLRFLAAFIVFLHHAGVSDSPAVRLAFGAIGVGFFFMLSGLILSHVYHQRLASEGRARFYMARLARIMPLHLLTAALALVLFPPSADWKELVRLGLNLSLLHGFFPLPSIYFSLNAPSWSLSAELLFYAAFPLLLPLVARLSPRGLLLALAAIFCAQLLWALAWNGDHWAVYIFPLARLAEFLAGMVLYRILARVTLSLVQATAVEAASLCGLALLVACYGMVPSALQWSVAFFFPCVLLLASFALSSGVLSRLLSWGPLVWLGEISFAFYMVHQLIIRSLPEAGFLVWLGLTVVASSALHHTIEIPAQRFLARRYSRPAVA